VTARLYIDETKARGYVIVAAVATEESLHAIRQQLRGLVLPGQAALHMKGERDSRRHAIADAIAGMVGLGLTATVYDAGRMGSERDRRARCIEAIVYNAVKDYDQARIVFDLDETLRQFDRQCLIEATRAADAGDRISYQHAHRRTEPLLAIPDALAWCWAKGGQWRRRVEPVIANVYRDV
jgi:hypothetical protein